MVPCVTCTTGRSRGQLVPPPRRDEVIGRWGSDRADEPHVIGQVAAVVLELGDRRRDHPVGEHGRIQYEHRQFRQPQCCEHGVGGMLRGAQRDLLRHHVQRAVAEAAERSLAWQDAGTARCGVPAGQEQRGRGVGQYRWARRCACPATSAVCRGRTRRRRSASKWCAAISSSSAAAWCGIGRMKKCLKSKLIRAMPGRFGAAGQVGVERRVVVVAAVGQRVRDRADGADLVGMPGRGQEGDVVAAIHQSAGHVEKRARRARWVDLLRTGSPPR